MGTRLGINDEGVHHVGEASNWNESRYLDFYDPETKVGGWFRIGNRPNEGHAEMSACIYLPDGRAAFQFGRVPITENGLSVGGQSWEIVEPWRNNHVGYSGPMVVLSDPWGLRDPKSAMTQNPTVDAEISLTALSTGLETVMGQDQDQVDLIFLPGQADHHYQHLAATTGTVRIGNDEWKINGRGGKDHSWGPRNWHAKIYLRWITASIDDDNGFILCRAVGPTKETHGGFLLVDGEFFATEDYEFHNTYAGAPYYELTGVDVTVRGGGHELRGRGTPLNWLPLRHRQQGADGNLATLRIVKSPAVWEFDDGRVASGAFEYHDLLTEDVPVGLHD